MDPQDRFLGELEAHKKILYKVARIYCANADDRQDLVQETVVQLWRSYPGFDGRSAFSTWMYRVALNVAISWVRGQRRERSHLLLDGAILDETLATEAAAEAIAAILGITATNVATRIHRIKTRLQQEHGGSPA